MISLDPWSPAPPDAALEGLLADARRAAGDPLAALALTDQAALVIPPPGERRTARSWRGLAELAAVDLTVARTLEPHLDALAILAQAADAGLNVPDAAGTWGVYAAEAPGARLEARVTGDGDLLLTGDKPWCSLAQHLDRALVTARLGDDQRILVAIDLRDPGVRLVDEPWVARGLAAVRSTGLRLTDVHGVAVGGPGWYLRRPGFAWGGLGVAACWLGGAVGLARRMRRATEVREPDQIALAHLGQVDAHLTAAATALGAAAAAVDAGRVSDEHAWARCVRTRHIVHECCELTLAATAHALGPAPLAGEEEHAARVADLQLYLRQHKAERDAALVGGAVAEGMPVWWG